MDNNRTYFYRDHSAISHISKTLSLARTTIEELTRSGCSKLLNNGEYAYAYNNFFSLLSI